MKVKDVYKANPVKNTNNYSDFINYIDTSSVVQGRLVDVQLLLNGEYPSRAQRKIKRGDILYSSVRPNLRHYYLYNDSLEHPVASTGFVLLRQFNDDYDNKFCYYYLSTEAVVTHLSNIAELSQATFPSFSVKDIENINLPCFSKDVQCRIASILSAYDNLIENNNKRIRMLEQMAENLYKEWFVRFRFPGHEKVEMENGLPKGWKTARLSDYADIIMGQSPESEYYNDQKEGLPFHQGVGSYGDFYLEDDIYATKGKKIAEPNSIIFSVRAPVGRINITLNRIILGRGVSSMNAKDKTNAFLLWMLKELFCKEDTIGNGAIFASVTKEELFKQKITLPSDDIRFRFNSIASEIEKEIRFLTLKNKNLAHQRDLLLPRLMSGKLEVKE